VDQSERDSCGIEPETLSDDARGLGRMCDNSDAGQRRRMAPMMMMMATEGYWLRLLNEQHG
jgi:hypothetical protein